jgi:hypothetical protein
VLRNILLIFAFVVAGCARLDPLTPEILRQAEQKWKAGRPEAYRMTVEMSGDRVEAGRFEISVQSGQVVSLRHNGMVLTPGKGQDYSMEGLFRMLAQELGLAEKPAMLGAPGGYTAYLTARFDENTGRLMRYRRTVGGASNTIDINVLEFAAAN